MRDESEISRMDMETAAQADQGSASDFVLVIADCPGDRSDVD